MGKNVTHDDYVQRLAIERPDLEVMEIYAGARTPISHRCKIHDCVWNIRPDNALHGKRCPECLKEYKKEISTLSHAEYLDKLKLVKSNIIPIDQYISAKVAIKHKCILHDEIFEATPDSLLRKNVIYCSKCQSKKIVKIKYISRTHYENEDIDYIEILDNHSNGRKRTQEEYLTEVEEKNPNIEVLEEYITLRKPIKHRCKKHDIVFTTRPEAILHGVGCKLCTAEKISATRTYSHEEYVKILHDKNPNAEIIGTYIDMLTPVDHKCLLHNNIWTIRPANVLRGEGCSQCRSNKISKFFLLSHEEYCDKLKEIGSMVIPVENYKGQYIQILHKCLVHNIEYMVSPISVLQGHGCRKCGSEKLKSSQTKSHEQYLKDLNNINSTIKPLDEYVKATTKILHKCEICNYEWFTSPSGILSGFGCPKCNSHIRRTHEEYVKDLLEINPNIEVIDQFINTSTHIKHKCLIHNYIWDGLPTTILRGAGCPKCASEKLSKALSKSHKQYIEELAIINPNVECLDIYQGANTSILHRCLLCDYEWKAMPGSFLSGHGCPRCVSSIGEGKIEKWLVSYDIEYIPQKRFDDCVDLRPLPFDFYLPSYNSCIEYDGKQHFEPIEHFGGKEYFQYTLKHDEIKNKYCEDNNIPLLRIPYYADVETELSNFLLI